ncbi:MAG TPA: phage tail protein [Candidatus Olsenella pullicola]|nr:phage tail protein [Candidatus Olsenella pullicola]
MYRVYLGGALAFDALEDDSVVVSASISQAINAAAYLDMELSPAARPEAGQSAEVLWDGARLFHGRVTEVEQRADGTWAASAVSDLDRLNDVLVPPHSTDGGTGSECPGTLSGYVRWLAETFNARQGGGFRVDVGTNQADLLREGALSLEDDSWPTVAAALEDHVLALGGYVDWEPHATSGTLSVWSDLHEASAQLVDLGANVTDISVTRSVEGRATAIVPHSGSGEGEVTLAGLTAAERQLVSNAGMSLTAGGDGIMDPASVSEWGYREERVEMGGVSSRADLVRAAIARLRTMAGPQVTVECRAVDMALYREDMAHLRVGQAVRVRAEPLGVDEYLAVQEMSLDLMDPAQTTYVLGVTYDTLTGRQSAFLRGLNGSINHALDVVTGVEDTIDRVVNDADTDYYLSDSPDEPVGGEWGSANVVPIDNKYLFSRPHNTLVDGSEVIGEPTLLTPSVQRSLKLHRDVGDEPVWVAFVAANSDVADDEAQGMCRITGQMGGWDASEQGAVTVAFGFQDSAYASGEGSAGVGVVTERSADIDTSKVSIQAYESQGRIGVYVMLTGKVTVSLYAEGDGFSTPFVEQSTQPSGTKVFDLADVQTTYESAILQADNAIRAYVAATYATQGALGEVQSTFDIRANQIQAQVEEKMDTSVAETRFTEKSTFNQFSDSISAEVEQVRETADAASTKAAQLEVSLDGITATVSETVSEALGDVSVGARNLLRNSRTLVWEGYEVADPQVVEYAVAAMAVDHQGQPTDLGSVDVGDGLYEEGETVTPVIEASDGAVEVARFVYDASTMGEDAGLTAQLSSTGSFAMPARDLVVVGAFAALRLVTVVRSGEGDVDVETWATVGTDMVVTVTPGEGWEVSHVWVEGDETGEVYDVSTSGGSGAALSYTFVMPDENVTVDVRLEEAEAAEEHPISYTHTGYGKVSGPDAAAAGSTVECVAEPNMLQYASSISVKGDSTGSVVYSDSSPGSGDVAFSFEMPDEAVTVSVAFKVSFG